jgi:hypothetical protein
MTLVVHRAGPTCEARGRLRQRCIWCGAILFDYELANVAVAGPAEPDWRPATAAPDSWWAVDGNASWSLPDERLPDASTQIPDGACFDLDPDVTR